MNPTGSQTGVSFVRSRGVDRVNLPAVSIGLPVYNGERTLERALTSILNQDFSDFELIISDNASQDATGAICQSFAERDRRIRYYRNQTNIGVNPNHDRVFELSRGKYFMWAAHDVELLEGMVKRCVETMIPARPSVVLVYPRCEMIRDGQKVDPGHEDSIECRDRRPYVRLGRVVSRVRMVNQLYGLMKTEALRKTQLNPCYPSSDYVLLAELAMLGEIWELPTTLIRRRIDSDRGTAAVSHDSAAWQTWLNPRDNNLKGAWLPHRELLAAKYLHAVWRLPLTATDKFMCLISILPLYYRRESSSVRFLLRVLRPWRQSVSSREQTRRAELSKP